MRFVYVIERSVLDKHLGFYPHGFMLNHGDESLKIAECIPQGFFVQRDIAEHRPDWKQIIPYCVITQNDKLWVMQRNGGGEGRLEGRFYLGVGGHINPCDWDEDGGALQDPWHNGMERELSEEAKFTKDGEVWTPPLPEMVGYVNDDNTEVGSVHFGLVYVLTLPPAVEIETEDKGCWMEIADIELMDTGKQESWTQMIAPWLASVR